jgi:hypothetical protein
MNHYELLQISADADNETVQKAATAQAVVWNRRAQGAADPEKRYEAERMVRRLQEAKLTLLDAEKRLAYDAALTLSPSSDGPAQAAPNPVDDEPSSVAPVTLEGSVSLPGVLVSESPPSPQRWKQPTRRSSTVWRVVGVATALLVTVIVLQSEFHRLVGMACYGMAEDSRLRAALPGRRVWLIRAKTEFYLATLLAPKQSEPLYNLAVAHVDLGENANAKAELERLLATMPPAAPALRDKARALLESIATAQGSSRPTIHR